MANGLEVEAPPDRGVFFQASGVSKGRGFTSLSIRKGREIWYCGLKGTFYGHKKDKKTSWWSDLFIFTNPNPFLVKNGIYKGKGWNSGPPGGYTRTQVKLCLITYQSLLQFRVAHITWTLLIDYFPIAHNTLCLPPKFCITYCLKMLLGKCNTPRSI